MNFDDTARIFGPSHKLWPELFVAPKQGATRLCRDCRRVEVAGNSLFCGRCAHKRKLASTRESKRARRGRDGRKVAFSPIRAEALTKAKTKGRYCDPQTAKSGPSFPTQKGGAQ